MTYPPRQPARDELTAEAMPWYDAIVGHSARYTYVTTGTADERAAAEVAPGDPDQNATPSADAGYYGMLARGPQMAVHFAGLGALGRALPEGGGTYSQIEGEWVSQVVCLELDAEEALGFGVHMSHGLTVGIRAQAIAALRAGRDADLTADELQIVEYVRAVVRGTVNEEQWLALEERLGERGIVEYTMFICFIVATVRIQQAIGLARTMIPEGTRPVDPDRQLEEYASGARPRLELAARIAGSVDYARRLRPPDARIA